MSKQICRLKLFYSDPAIVVVQKPGGVLAVPGRGPDKQDCIVNTVKSMFPDCIEQPAVHRLDMQTSGLMVLARTRDAHRLLSHQFEKRWVKKRYIALLDGIVKASSGKIRLSFRLDPENRPYQIYDPVHGKPGITLWKTLAVESGRTRVEFIPLTGRTHQLRVHSAHPSGLGCPIVGDRLYGRGREDDPMLLHAAFLAFRHPITGTLLQFHSPENF